MKYRHSQAILDQCVELFANIIHFSPAEFKHPHKMYRPLLEFLDDFRDNFNAPIIITDDWRAESTNPSGSSKTSWHKKGRAVDFRIKHLGPNALYKLVKAFYQAQADLEEPIEFELVWSTKDKHGHIAFMNEGSPPKLLIKAD